MKSFLSILVAVLAVVAIVGVPVYLLTLKPRDESRATLLDNVCPQISTVLALVDMQEVINNVNITCLITDNVGVNTVKVNVTGPIGFTSINITMTKIVDTNKYYSNFSSPSIGTYYYYIWANDTSNNQNKSVNYAFSIADNTKSLITNVKAMPSAQIVSECVNITCTVTDNVAVNTVRINITGPTGFTSLNVTMIRYPGTDSYYYNATYSFEGTYNYYIWANDTNGNEEISMIYQFYIISAPDTEKSLISNVQVIPSIQEVYGYVNITCTVTDNVGVNTVKVNITYPNELTSVNVTMIRITGTDNYYYNVSYSATGTYYYYIWASDGNDNQNKTQTHIFFIQDVTKPSFADVQAIPNKQTAGGYVNITCRVWDNVRVSVVKVNITGSPGFAPVNTTMRKITNTDSYYYNATYFVEGIYSYYIWANDTNTNHNKSLNYPFIIISPYISHAPLYIDGNDSFAAQAANESWYGNGTETNPYIIENYDINASSANGIEIRNTNVCFIIRNCVIHDGNNSSYYGLYFHTVTYGTVEKVVSYNNYYGIYLRATSRTYIINCTVYSNYDGISICPSCCLHSSSNAIINCTVYNNSHSGIYISYYSDDHQITRCNIYNNSYGVYLENSARTAIHYSNIYNNTDYGVYNNEKDPTYRVDATYCWWGFADGPGGEGHGSGDAISSNVLYDPWLITPVSKAAPQISCYDEDTRDTQEIFGIFEEVGVDIKALIRAGRTIFMMGERYE